MIFALWLLLAAAPVPEVVLTNDVVEIQPSEWRPFNFTVTHVPMQLKCTFQSISPEGKVRLVVLSKSDLQQFARNQANGFLRASPEASNGTLPVEIREPGEYAVLMINGSALPKPTQIHLFVAEEFAPRIAGPTPRYLSDQRRMVTLLLSFLGFFATVSWSASKLLRAMRGAK